MRIRKKYCRTCGEYRAHELEETSHVLHLLLSVFTLGIWLPIWLIVALLPKSWHCRQCGSCKWI